MSLVTLNTIYKNANWTQDGGAPHTDYSSNEDASTAAKNSNAAGQSPYKFFYTNNQKNTDLDQLNAISDGKGLSGLKTTLKSLKFGKDQKLGGDSGQPFITFDQSGNALFAKNGYISVSGSSLVDWPIRGGSYPSNDIDSQRIKLFLETDAGKRFIDKQKTLQFSNPKMETGPSFIASDQANTLPGLIENTRVYSTANLLGQVSVEGTGAHINRVGNPRFGSLDDFYASTVGIQNILNDATTNRLDILRRIKMNVSNRTGFFNDVQNFSLATKMGISFDPNLIFNYVGGPDSSFQNGTTIVGRYSDTTFNNLDTVMNYAELAQQNAIQSGVVNPTNIQDFRTDLRPYQSSNMLWSYAANSQESRIGIINSGKIIKSDVSGSINPQGKPTDYRVFVSSDKINTLLPTLTYNGDDPWTSIGAQANDSVKLAFECMSNDNTSIATALVFRALLSNGFSDNNSALLNSFRYAGRGDEFFTYQGFIRSIAFSFKIAAFSRSELKPLYNKLNYLISQVYPDYAPNTGIMRAPLVKITLGDYLYRLPGFIESINVIADNATPWEINLENQDDVQELPHVLEVSITFKPIFSGMPERSVFKSYHATLPNNSNGFTANTAAVTPLIVNNSNGFIDPAIAIDLSKT